MSWDLNRRSFFALLGAGALTLSMSSPLAASASTDAEAMAALIARRKVMLTGDGSAASIPELADALAAMNAKSVELWQTMIAPSGTSGIWADLPLTGIGSVPTATDRMGLTFNRLFDLALAYGTTGTELSGDGALGADLVRALTNLSENVYKVGMRRAGNWWFWEIGVPRKAAEILVLLYDIVPVDVRTSLLAAVRSFTPDPNWRGTGTSFAETGANRTDKALSCALRGILDGRADEIALARDALSDTVRGGRNSVFGYVTHGDGFYQDGSFIQHGFLPYVGTYGSVTLGGLAEILGLLGGSPWKVTDPKQSVILDAVERSFAPFVWNGRMMDTVRGRAVSRQHAPDYVDGAGAITAMLLLAPGAGEPYRTRYLSLAKGWIERCDVKLYGLPSQTIVRSLRVTSVLGDDSIEPARAPVYTKAFGDQDRLVHHRPAFSSVVNISSKRIGRYEWGNSENNLGWYQGDGMTFFYTPTDPGQYSDDFWPTVDPYQLPGTTVTAAPRKSGATGGTGIPRAFQAFAGGLDLDGRWGIQGMDHLNHDRSLKARTSWFFLDDKVVCVGSAIASGSGHEVFTTIENRSFAEGTVPRIRTDNRNRVMAPGDRVRVSRNVHIVGHGGYVLLQGEGVSGDVDVQVIRRTGDWRTINSGGDTGGTDEIKTRDYVTITHRHGTDPTAGGYAYMVLPNVEHSVTFTESDAPTVSILANNATVQMVRDASVDLTLANFFAAGEAAGVKTSGPCSVAVRSAGARVTVAVSDPSRTQSVARVTLAGVTASEAVEADTGVRVVGTSPLTLEFELDGHGHSKQITLG